MRDSAVTIRPDRKQTSSRSAKRRLALTQGTRLNFERLEDRNLLAAITVTNATDLVSPAADTSSITALVANDGGDGISLREAIAATNNTLGEDTITFDGSVFSGGANSLIRLTQGELEITETLTLDASAATGVTITGDANGDDITLPGTFITDVVASSNDSFALLEDNSRLMNFTSGDLGDGGSLTLSHLSLTGGRTRGNDGSGGGVRSFFGDVLLTSSSVNGNFSSVRGGGIYSFSGDISLTNSSVSGNRANGGEGNRIGGGGISSVEGDVSLTDSDVSGNSALALFPSAADSSGGPGGGIVTLRGAVSLSNSTVIGNSSYLGGGGIAARTVTLNHSTVSDNSTSGSSLLARGGGIAALRNAEIEIIESTVSGNSTSGSGAYGGGISLGSGNLSLTNSTISGNSTTGDGANGGGIFTQRRGNVSLFNSTISGNSVTGDGSFGGGISLENVFDGYGQFTIVNSIVAGNTDDGIAPDFLETQGAEIVVEHSLIGDTNGSGISETTGNRNILNQPALLGPLADNGGPTLTHALLSGSPAIDAGSNTLALDADGVPLATDQRGDGFDRIKLGRVDIGAFESDFDASAIAPSVLSVTIDEGGVLARPDLLNTLTFVFDSDVTVDAEDLSLFNDSLGGVAVDLSGIGFSYDSIIGTAAWDFSTLNNPLEAAFYTYQLNAGSIINEGLPLDGNADGTGGDNFVGHHYVAIPGDANLDGVVDVLNDAFALIGNLNSTTNLAFADGNFNGDDRVDVLGDAFILVGNLNRDVRSPVAATLSASLSSKALVEPELPSTSPALVGSSNIGVSQATINGDKQSTPEGVVAAASPTLALAGDQQLRDDVFGSDF